MSLKVRSRSVVCRKLHSRGGATRWGGELAVWAVVGVKRREGDCCLSGREETQGFSSFHVVDTKHTAKATLLESGFDGAGVKSAGGSLSHFDEIVFTPAALVAKSVRSRLLLLRSDFLTAAVFSQGF